MELISESLIALSGESSKVEYALLKSSRHCPSGSGSVYSLICLSFDREGLVDQDFIYDISSDRATASRIFNAVVSGKVTPVSVKEVLYDLLSAS